MIEYSQQSFKLPFVMSGQRETYYHICKMLDKTINVSNIHNTLPAAACFILGWVDGEQFAVVYSPALLGRKLDEDSTEDAIWAFQVALDELNSAYQQSHTTTQVIPFEIFVQDWEDACNDCHLSALETYEQWLSQYLKMTLNREVSKVGGPAPVKKF